MGANVSIDFLELFKNDWFLLADMADMFIGGTVGTGNSRSVFDFQMDPKYVVKIDRGGHFDNVAEWDIWNGVPMELKQWLAPCLRISECGRVLIQEKTTPVQLEDMPKFIPAFFQDFKLQNWGKIGDNIVCHDYANHKFYSKDHGMMEPEWWSDTFQVQRKEDLQVISKLVEVLTRPDASPIKRDVDSEEYFRVPEPEDEPEVLLEPENEKEPEDGGSHK